MKADKGAERDGLLSLITPTTDYDAIKDSDLVVEAVFEDREVKSDVIGKTREAVNRRRHAVCVEHVDAADHVGRRGVQRPPGFIGIHFFSPVDRMMLVEIILGKTTGAGDARQGARYCKR